MKMPRKSTLGGCKKHRKMASLLAWLNRSLDAALNAKLVYNAFARAARLNQPCPMPNCADSDGRLAGHNERVPEMKVFVQKVATGEFLTTEEMWSVDRIRAWDFEGSVAALDYCLNNRLQGVQVLLAFGDSGDDDVVLGMHSDLPV